MTTSPGLALQRTRRERRNRCVPYAGVAEFGSLESLDGQASPPGPGGIDDFLRAGGNHSIRESGAGGRKRRILRQTRTRGSTGRAAFGFLSG